MTASFDGIRKKVARAYEHLETLNTDIQTFLDTDPWTFRREVEPDHWQVYRAVIQREPPLELGIVVGDIAHNLRSALDHMVWQLALANHRLPGEHSQFPVFRTRRGWDEMIERRPPPPGKKKLPHRTWLKGVGRQNQALIKSLQPFSRAYGGVVASPTDWIIQIAWLNNFDKHRTIHSAFGYVGEPTVTVLTPGYVLADEIPAGVDSRVEPDAELLRLRVRNVQTGDYETEVEMKFRFPIGIAFGEWTRPLGARLFNSERLAALTWYVESTIGIVERQARLRA